MTRALETAADSVDATPKQGPSTRARLARRIGVGVAAAALVAPLALPAFASPNEAQEVGFAATASDAQSVTAEPTAGSPEQEAERQELYATTPEQLAELRAELDAQAAAEEQAQQEAEEQAAAEAAADEQAAATADEGAAAPADDASADAAAPAGVGGSAVASAALGQIGVTQDCTALVANSLAAVGIPYTGMGNLFNLGPTIPQSAASPGDVIYYANGGVGSAHVAIYIGDGQAVHGGWAGNQTVVAGAVIPGASAPVFIDIT